MERLSMTSMNHRTGLRSHALTACALILLSSTAALLTGCGSFFQCEGKASCPTTTCVPSSTVTCPATGTGPVLTALVNSPYAAPASVGALAIDSTGAYLIAAGYNATSGIQLYSVGSAGALTPSVSAIAGSGTVGAIPTEIAVTHPVTGSTAPDYAYVSNAAIGPTNLNGYTLASGTLAAATGAPFALGANAVPQAIAITPANTYLYLSTDSNFTNPSGIGNIYGYSITTGGALSILASGKSLLQENDAALAISPDGQWLFTLPIDGQQINEYPITSSTGLLGQLAAYYGLSGASGGLILPLAIAVAPTGQYFAAALGTGGADVYSFDTTTGQGATTPVTISPANSSTGIYAVAFDNKNNLYCAGTAGLEVFSISTAGAVTLVKTYTTGNGAHSIVINGASTAVYVGNQTDGTITGYSIATN